MSLKTITDLKVESLSNKGLGIVKISGRAYLVEGVYPEDLITVELDDEWPAYSEVKLLSLERPSPKRVAPECEHFGSCRGCTLMALDYNEQLALKTEKLRHQLEKNQIATTSLRPILPSPKTIGYRNRGQFKVNETQIGYADKFGKEIIPIHSCRILSDSCRKFFHDLHSTLPNPDLAPGIGYEWNYIDFNQGTTLENYKLNTRLPFAQGNTEINSLMKDWLKTKLEETAAHKTVVEFFCGSGNFTEIASRSPAREVVAIEVQGIAVEELKKKNFHKVKIIEEDLFKSNVWKKLEPEIKKAGVWLLDPPRAGLNYQRAWIKTMPKLTDIFYISCEPESFARDIAQFVRLGFEVEEILPVDQFPHTIHFEILSHLKRKNVCP